MIGVLGRRKLCSWSTDLIPPMLTSNSMRLIDQAMAMVSYRVLCSSRRHDSLIGEDLI